MANFVKISTIGAHLYPVSTLLSPEQTVEVMLAHWQKEIDQVLPDRPDLIVLPETCDTPTDADAPPDYPKRDLQAYFAARGDRMLTLLSGIAKANHCYITYPALWKNDAGAWVNRVTMIDRQGGVAGYYDKNYLFIGENTENGVLFGSEAPLIPCDFGKVACVICFDLNVDELRLRYQAAKPDLILFCTVYNGGLMQPYWAYSCRAHLVSAVSGGTPSHIISPVGEILDSTTNYFDFLTTTVNLDCAVAHLDFNWEKLTAMKRKYGTKVKVTDPGCLGSILFSSETPEFTVQDLITEFDIELLDDYLARAAARRQVPGQMVPPREGVQL
ncbi:MAG: carbon-nitrogen hydrolase family protein [Armatimonadota bacterium]